MMSPGFTVEIVHSDPYRRLGQNNSEMSALNLVTVQSYHLFSRSTLLNFPWQLTRCFLGSGPES